MKWSNQWTLTAILAILVSVTTQQTLPKPAPPPANFTDVPSGKTAFYVQPSANGPVYISTAYFRPHERVTTGKVITSPPHPANQRSPFQVPGPLSSAGFQGHAAYFQKVFQEGLQQKPTWFQTLQKHFFQPSIQRQQLEEQQMQQLLLQQQQIQQQRLEQHQIMLQAQQYFQQMHPLMRQEFLKLSPATQFQHFQQYLRYRQFLQEQALKTQNNKKTQQLFVPQARVRQQEQSTTESSNYS